MTGIRKVVTWEARGNLPYTVHCTTTLPPCQGGIRYFASWQLAVFINYFAPDSGNRGTLNDSQLTFNATKCLFLPKKSLWRMYSV